MSKEPWGPKTPWKTKSAFFTYLRGCLRKAWSTNPIKIQVLKNNRKQIPNPNPKGNKATVWGCTCSLCGLDHVMKDIQVDHITPAGSLQCLEDVQGFVERLLYITESDLRVVCKSCNSLLAYADKHKISLEEAIIDKEVIRLIKAKQDKLFFEERNLSIPSNAVKRRKDIKQILLKEMNVQI